MVRFPTMAALALGLVGCAMTKQEQVVDLTAAYNAAAAAEAGYAARGDADPVKVSQYAHLLAAAQAALLTWSNSAAPADATAVSSAMAALFAYQSGLAAPASASAPPNH